MCQDVYLGTKRRVGTAESVASQVGGMLDTFELTYWQSKASNPTAYMHSATAVATAKACS